MVADQLIARPTQLDLQPPVHTGDRAIQGEGGNHVVGVLNDVTVEGLAFPRRARWAVAARGRAGISGVWSWSGVLVHDVPSPCQHRQRTGNAQPAVRLPQPPSTARHGAPGTALCAASMPQVAAQHIGKACYAVALYET